jgi:hypothetical protein
MTVNIKEENSYNFCPKCVQEFGLWTEMEQNETILKYHMTSAEQRPTLLESLSEIGWKFNYRNLGEERYSVPSSKNVSMVHDMHERLSILCSVIGIT